MSAAHAREQGFALAAALLAVAVASTIGSAVVEIARLEVVLARQRRTTLDALAAVDACAEQATTALAAGWEFDPILRGADGVLGTSDDGLVTLPAGCTGSAHPAPGPPMPPRMLLELEAMRGSGRRRLDALVRRRTAPGVPAVLWATAPGTFAPVTGSLTLDGVDPAMPVAPLAAVGTPDDPALLDAWLLAQGSAVSVSAGTTGPIWAQPVPIGEIVTRAAAAAAVPPAVGLTASAPAPPALTLATGDLAITAPAAGAGVLVVPGVLSIGAPLQFVGVVVAGGGVRVGAAGTLTLSGGLWLGDGSLQTLAVDGSATLTASDAALAGADALLTLPRPARIAAVRDF
jgi:hypothetical protein